MQTFYTYIKCCAFVCRPEMLQNSKWSTVKNNFKCHKSIPRNIRAISISQCKFLFGELILKWYLGFILSYIIENVIVLRSFYYESTYPCMLNIFKTVCTHVVICKHFIWCALMLYRGILFFLLTSERKRYLYPSFIRDLCKRNFICKNW